MARYGDLDALEKKLFPIGMVDDGRYALPAKSVKVAIDNLPTADVAPKSEVAREIFAEIDNALHDMAMEYADAGHKTYFAVCEMVHHKVMRPIEKKYIGEQK